MGGFSSKIPPIEERDVRALLSYNLTESSIQEVYKYFCEIDDEQNGVWTVSDFYKAVNEPQNSLRAPVLDTLFFMADSTCEGNLSFPDFLVTICSFCCLSKEEILQFFFMIIDVDRNGTIEREELINFFSFTPVGTDDSRPVFPVNNKHAVDKFRGGKWESIQFDGLAQFCELFPYIPYPVYHTQDMFRSLVLGKGFWTRLEDERIKYQTITRTKRVRYPGTNKKIEVRVPGRVTMQELLEFSRRKTAVQGGKRVCSQEEGDGGETESFLKKERDQQIMRSPILNMIRNPRCMYYVPLDGGGIDAKAKLKDKQTKRSELELPATEVREESQSRQLMPRNSFLERGVTAGAPKAAQMLALIEGLQRMKPDDALSDAGSYYDDEESEEDM